MPHNDEKIIVLWIILMLAVVAAFVAGMIYLNQFAEPQSSFESNTLKILRL